MIEYTIYSVYIYIYMGTSRLLCHLAGQPPGHQTWSLHSRAEVGNRSTTGPVAKGCEPNWVENATGQVSFPGGPDIEKKTESRPSSCNLVGRYDPPTHLKEGAKN